MNTEILLIISSVLTLLSCLLIVYLLSKNFTQQRHFATLEMQLDSTQQQQQKFQEDLARQFTVLQQHSQQTKDMLLQQLNDHQSKQQAANHHLQEDLSEKFSLHRQRFDEHQINNLKTLQESLQLGLTNSRQQLTEALQNNTQHINAQIEKLTKTVAEHLKEISGQVEKRLADGFEKTTATFADIVKRLALIDQAQKKITELSNNVVSLQEILSDKRSRGAFGEVQLASLIRNMLPEKHFELQYTLSNAKRVDCMLFLPAPTGNVAVDAKFPLETYRKLTNADISAHEQQQLEQQFRIDIKTHIQHIASKYIIPGETADGAVMFIPAEAIFAEIHSHFPELVEHAQQKRVWLVSPTTMMAILTTARAVLKDEATRQQVHIIQQHLGYLAKDFERFQKRMDNLARHISQANSDVEEVHTSARKISSRFAKIEQVEIESAPLVEDQS